MSTIKANAYLDSAGGNTATVNGITVALSSQAQAQAGTDNTTLMTPLRASDAITALANGMTLLGTLTTTSGSTQTLSGLTLTSYKQLLLEINGVSHNSGTNQSFSVGSLTFIQSIPAAATPYGIVWVSLVTGNASALLSNGTTVTASAGVAYTGSGLSTASTSVSVSTGGGTFDAGTIRVYGVR
jgi:hypothetical protein